MTKTRRERRADAVRWLNALTRERSDYKASDILAYALYGGHQEDYCESTDEEDLCKLIDLFIDDKEPPYDALIRVLKKDHGLVVSWDGLRRFWNVERANKHKDIKLSDLYGILRESSMHEREHDESDSREKLEADVCRYFGSWVGGAQRTQEAIRGWLDRQASITACECSDDWMRYKSGADEEIAQLRKANDGMRSSIEKLVAENMRLERERDELTESVDYISEWDEKSVVDLLKKYERGELLRDCDRDTDVLIETEHQREATAEMVGELWRSCKYWQNRYDFLLDKLKYEWNLEARQYGEILHKRHATADIVVEMWDEIKDLHLEYDWLFEFHSNLAGKCGTKDCPSLVAYVNKLESQVKHQKEATAEMVGELYEAYFRSDVTNESLEQQHEFDMERLDNSMRLPVGRDGNYIHVNDRLETKHFDHILTVDVKAAYVKAITYDKDIPKITVTLHTDGCKFTVVVQTILCEQWTPLGKDGLRIAKGDIVYGEDGVAFEVVGILNRRKRNKNHCIMGKVIDGDGRHKCLKPEWLTHKTEGEDANG